MPTGQVALLRLLPLPAALLCPSVPGSGLPSLQGVSHTSNPGKGWDHTHCISSSAFSRAGHWFCSQGDAGQAGWVQGQPKYSHPSAGTAELEQSRTTRDAASALLGLF